MANWICGLRVGLRERKRTGCEEGRWERVKEEREREGERERREHVIVGEPLQLKTVLTAHPHAPRDAERPAARAG